MESAVSLVASQCIGQGTLLQQDPLAIAMAHAAVSRLGLRALVGVIGDVITMRAREFNESEDSALLAKKWENLGRRCGQLADGRNKLVHSRLTEKSTDEIYSVARHDRGSLTAVEIVRRTVAVDALRADLEQFVGDMLRAFTPADALPSPVRDGD
jgi:hypothetical protein